MKKFWLRELVYLLNLLSPRLKPRTRTRRTPGDLKPGEEAVIACVHHQGGSGQRLMALGILPGCRLKFLRLAPLGDPLLIEVAGCAYCLRRREAGLIELCTEEGL